MSRAVLAASSSVTEPARPPPPGATPPELLSAPHQAPFGRHGRRAERPGGRGEWLEHESVEVGQPGRLDPAREMRVVPADHDGDVEVARVLVHGPTAGEAPIHRHAELPAGARGDPGSGGPEPAGADAAG